LLFDALGREHLDVASRSHRVWLVAKSGEAAERTHKAVKRIIVEASRPGANAA